jgi:hypothetical protein
VVVAGDVAGCGVGAPQALLRIGLLILIIDAFVRTQSGKDALRQAFYDATMARLEMEPLNVRILTDMDYRHARLVAEQLATTDIYLFNDDDCLPHGKNWTETGLKAMLAHPEYGACSTKSLIVNESPFDTKEKECDIFPVPCVGAPMWVRKGIIKDDLPEYLFVSECIEIHNYMKKKGFKQGIINGIKHVHIGHGFSTSADIWGY